MDVEKYVVGVCVKQSLYASVLRTVPYDHSHLYSHTHTVTIFDREKGFLILTGGKSGS